MGHPTLDVLRIYTNMAQADVQEAHRHNKPANNLPCTIVKKHEEDVRHEQSDAKVDNPGNGWHLPPLTPSQFGSALPSKMGTTPIAAAPC